MRSDQSMQEPIKSDDGEHPVPTRWRPTFEEIVKAFGRGDYTLALGVQDVVSPTESKARQLQRSVEEYGESLVELPPDAWRTSVSLWMRTHWEVHVDLWTAESGASDLVLNARVFEVEGDKIKIEIRSIHVP